MTRSATSATTPRSWVMSTIAAPIRRLRSRIRSRICAWMVTSSAVVGSSAMSSFGLQASAIAIITRWRMPPESWCGYSRRRRLRDADEVQHLDGAVLRRAPLDAFMQAQRLAQLAPDRQHRIEAGHRLLEDHADVVAADVAHRALGQRQEIAALKPDRAGDLAGRLGDEAQDRVRGDGLAAAALADDRQRLALLDLEGDAVDGAVDAVRGPEMGLQILDVEQRHRSRSPSPCADRERRAARRRGDSRRARSRRGRSPG